MRTWDPTTLSTSALSKMLNDAAAGSAQQKAIQQELRAREQKRPDTSTLLFPGAKDWFQPRQR